MGVTQVAGPGRVLYDSGGWTVAAMGSLVLVSVFLKTGGGSWDTAKCPYVLPKGLRPPVTWRGACTTQNGGSVTGTLYANTDGTMTVANQGGSGSDGYRSGSLCFVATG